MSDMDMTATVSVDQVVLREPEEHRLRGGVLGVGAITFLVVSAAGPLVGFAGAFPIAMLFGNGAGLPAALSFVMLVLLAFAAGYTAMARRVTNAGGFYAFAAQGLGGQVGGVSALIALVSYNAMQIGIYGMFGVASAGFLKDLLGITLPWWSYSLLALGVIAVLGYRQVDLSTKILLGLVVGEYLGIFLVDFAILRTGGASGVEFSSFSPSVFLSGSVSMALLFGFASFIGFESTTIYSEEARNPERTIPLATYWSVLLIGGFYAFSLWCMVVGAGSEKVVPLLKGLSDPTEFLFILSSQYAGNWLTLLLRFLFVTSVFAGLLAFHNASARYFYAIGRDGLLPALLGTTHKRHKSPHIGSLCQSLLAVVVVAGFALAGADPVLSLFSWLTNVGTLGIVILMTLSSFAVVVFFTRRPEFEGGLWRTRILPASAGVVFAVIVSLSVWHFDLLTGASKALSLLLPGLILVAALAGWYLAVRLKRYQPDRYSRLGSSRL